MLDRERVQAIHALTPLRNDAASIKARYERLKREVEQLERESVGAALPERGDGWDSVETAFAIALGLPARSISRFVWLG